MSKIPLQILGKFLCLLYTKRPGSGVLQAEVFVLKAEQQRRQHQHLVFLNGLPEMFRQPAVQTADKLVFRTGLQDGLLFPGERRLCRILLREMQSSSMLMILG